MPQRFELFFELPAAMPPARVARRLRDARTLSRDGAPNAPERPRAAVFRAVLDACFSAPTLRAAL